MTKLESASEEEQVRALAVRARDDPQAFGQLYELFVDRVYGFALRRLGSPAEAQDVTAETFLRALEGIGGFAWRGGGFGAWLFRIARNLCNDALSHRQRLGPLFADALPAPDSADPEQAAVAGERAAKLRELIALLPEPQQEAIMLKYLAGLSNRDIALATGRTATAVSSLLNRTTSKLRRELGEGYV